MHVHRCLHVGRLVLTQPGTGHYIRIHIDHGNTHISSLRPLGVYYGSVPFLGNIVFTVYK